MFFNLMKNLEKYKHEIKIILFCILPVLMYFYEDYQIKTDLESILCLKRIFNEQYENLDKERAFLLKILINNYVAVKNDLEKVNIFELSTSKLQKIIQNIKFTQNIKRCKYSGKMLLCSLGPIFIPLLSFVFK